MATGEMELYANRQARAKAGEGRAMVPQLEFEADAKEVDLERNVQV